MAKIDPHEMYTAALLVRGEKINVNDLNTNARKNTKTLVEKLADAAMHVNGGTGSQGFFSEVGDTKIPKFHDLAKAISVSNYALDQLPSNAKIKKVWQTGGTWASEIRRFNPDTGTIKNYNSSDVVLEIETLGKNEATHFWGISLKKRAIKQAEPTLLNKPVVGNVGFMIGRFTPAQVKNINESKDLFFREVLNIVTGGTYKKKDITKMTLAQVLKACDEIFHGKRTFKNEMLTGSGEFKGNKNIYFEAMNDAFLGYVNNPKNTKPFFEEFFDLIFKINLDAYIKDSSFHFSLITGIGDYSISQDKLEVEPASEKEGRLVSEILRKMFKDPDVTAFQLKKQEGAKKLHAWEPGAKAAKLFYEMVIGHSPNDVSIVDLEVRFKGHLTTEPQFQVFVNRVRQNGFAKHYAKVAKKEALGKTRWE
mgnify:CR=1 FL=1|tara:strand:+ start:200 stop:1465 length:1266 start_codon:yes stop_codon:yes gene_type:complete